MKEMPKSYDHQGVEDRLYEKWEKNGYFHAEPNPDKEPYCIVIPPPNITGQLHMGHAHRRNAAGCAYPLQAHGRVTKRCGCPAPTMRP